VARFPKKEDAILALINKMVAGYQTYPTEFPNGDPAALVVVREEYKSKKLGQVCKEAWAHLATESKDVALDALTVRMQAELEYRVVAMNTAGTSVPSNSVAAVL